MSRAEWTGLTDARLLAQCAVDTYRASGPGGQKRNKTSSAVRIRHLPSGLLVIAEESRSQHENKAKALVRLRQRFWLAFREIPPAEAPPVPPKLGRKDPRFWPAVGLALDWLEQAQGQVSTAAPRLGLSTGQLIDFLETEDSVFAAANQIRQHYQLKPLKAD